jgi:alkylation response protein AidB-like acyl-CoA dehydrogenase
MCLVQSGLLGYTIELLGSEEQKKKYLPKIVNLEWIGGWGLTEDKIGSDASNINTSVTKTN